VRTVLTPSGHAAVDELRVAGEALVGADAETLHHAGAEALGQRVGALDEIEQGGDPDGVLEIDGDVSATTLADVGVRTVGLPGPHGTGALDADHLGAEVGQQHCGERTGSDPGDLDDPVSSEWSWHLRSFDGTT